MALSSLPTAERSEPESGGSDDSEALKKCRDLFLSLPATLRDRYYGDACNPPHEKNGTRILVDMMLDMCGPGQIREEIRKASMNDADAISAIDINDVHKLFVMDKKVEKVFRDYKESFPASVWNCCTQFCFTKLAVKEENFLAFSEVLRIKEVA